MSPGSHQKSIKSQECGGNTHDRANFCHVEKLRNFFYRREQSSHLKRVKREMAQFVAQVQQESDSTMGLHL
jgi:uncharacterized protein YdaU (DUF1376 family)